MRSETRCDQTPTPLAPARRLPMAMCSKPRSMKSTEMVEIMDSARQYQNVWCRLLQTAKQLMLETPEEPVM